MTGDVAGATGENRAEASQLAAERGEGRPQIHGQCNLIGQAEEGNHRRLGAEERASHILKFALRGPAAAGPFKHRVGRRQRQLGGAGAAIAGHGVKRASQSGVHRRMLTLSLSWQAGRKLYADGAKLAANDLHGALEANRR